MVVDGLRKSYGDTTAVDGLSFSVDAGECVAILGPNGAGKTTTVEILEGFRPRDGGDVRVLGFDPTSGDHGFRERIGTVLQSCGIERYLTVGEVLALHAGYYPAPLDPDHVLDLVGLEAKADARVKTLSGGQQRRVDLALGIIGDPELIFLDEPTTGFDPSARRAAWTVVDNLRALGKTVLLTTHYMDEAQHLADRLLVIAHGQLVAEGSPDDLGARTNRAARVRFFPPAGAVLPATLSHLFEPDGTGGALVAETPTPTRLVNELTGWAVASGIELDGLSITRPSLEDVYLELIGAVGP
ncbi:MAG: ABC transporter ATP-binding protein [Actinobacteria bacterium]|nr:ABC transporter ATP-binding protein [Actinomycetota bacterium]